MAMAIAQTMTSTTRTQGKNKKDGKDETNYAPELRQEGEFVVERGKGRKGDVCGAGRDCKL